jgi:3'-5' exoribonuclease
MKIKELKNGTRVTVTLLVLEAAGRLTKTKKNYLVVTFSDGIDTIVGNYWDWAGNIIPDKGILLDVVADVGSWQGIAQLTILKLTTNSTADVKDFLPSSNNDIDYLFDIALEIVSNFVKDESLCTLGLTILERYKDKWKSIPAAKLIHHAYIGGTLVHSVSVAKIAIAIAAQVPEANGSLCALGGLLHDVGKLDTYFMNGVVIDMTYEGLLLDHSFLGASLIERISAGIGINVSNEVLVLLKHIILSHHGTLEQGAVIQPKCLEAYIVSHSDAIDAAAEQLRNATATTEDIWTDKLWGLNNLPHITPTYTKRLLKE